MRISEVARRTGVASSAIRFYEKEGLIPRTARVGGQRDYDDEVLERIAVIRLGQSAGFTVRELRVLLGGLQPGRKLSTTFHALARRKEHELSLALTRTRSMLALLRIGLRCGVFNTDDCAELKEAARRAILRDGTTLAEALAKRRAAPRARAH
jgi:MerR family redox-sensitive transcriptional activator SoxR